MQTVAIARSRPPAPLAPFTVNEPAPRGGRDV